LIERLISPDNTLMKIYKALLPGGLFLFLTQSYLLDKSCDAIIGKCPALRTLLRYDAEKLVKE